MQNKQRRGQSSGIKGSPAEVSSESASNSKEPDDPHDDLEPITNGYPTPSTEHKRKRETENGVELSRRSKRRRSQKKLGEHGNEAKKDVTQLAKSTIRKRKKAAFKDEDGSQGKPRESWVVSGGVGGRLLPIDPIFSHDEKYGVPIDTQTLILI